MAIICFAAQCGLVHVAKFAFSRLNFISPCSAVYLVVSAINVHWLVQCKPCITNEGALYMKRKRELERRGRERERKRVWVGGGRGKGRGREKE